MSLKQLFTILVLTLIIGVSGCGFKLRGSAEPLPEPIRQLSVVGIDSGSSFYKVLAQGLKDAGATLVAAGEVVEQAKVTIHKVEPLREELSDSGGQTLYRTSYIVSFSLNRGDEERLIDSRQIRASREFSFDSNNPYGLEQQDQLLRSELQRDLIQQLIRQIRAAGSKN
ncbi:MAG: LPS assembly lipoprotein LptE [Gammaproteobacteria bacterium]|nr:LPS assembly lipoprotein LptE [Gammaproteobacteria bacterium]